MKRPPKSNIDKSPMTARTPGLSFPRYDRELHRSVFRQLFSKRFLIIVGLVVFTSGFTTSRIVSKLDIDRMIEHTTADVERTASLVSALSRDAVILEDGPYLETIIEQAVAIIPGVQAIFFANEDGLDLASWRSDLETDRGMTLGQSHVLALSRDIAVAGETFGTLHLQWNIKSSLQKIQDEALIVNLLVAGTSLGFSITILLIIFFGRQLLEDRERHYREAQEAALRAELESKYKTDFLAHMSHELRTPLNAVIGFSQILLDKEPAGLEGERSQPSPLQMIHDAGNHLLAIINDVLDTSKIQAGEVSLVNETFNLCNTARSVTEILSPQAEAGNVAFQHCPGDGERMAINADERLVKQILYNLIGNSIKFSEVGTTITISMATTSDQCLKLKVIDQGSGIAPEDIEEVLMPYGQISSDRSNKFKGTGLGLPLCNQIAMLHDASLDIESTLGIGTTVTVTFPPERTR